MSPHIFRDILAVSWQCLAVLNPSHCTRIGHLAAIPPNILKIVITRDGQPFTVRYALQNYPPRARHGVCVRDGAVAFKMRFRIANPWIKRSWVNCEQVSFWFQKQERPSCTSIISL